MALQLNRQPQNVSRSPTFQEAGDTGCYIHHQTSLGTIGIDDPSFPSRSVKGKASLSSTPQVSHSPTSAELSAISVGNKSLYDL